MKNIIQSIWNVILYLFFTLCSEMWFVIWYGKLPKVSVYHRMKYSYKFKDDFKCFNDEFHQTNYHKDPSNKTVDQFIDEMRTDKRLRDLTFPRLDHNGRKIGTTGLFGIVNEFKK